MASTGIKIRHVTSAYRVGGWRKNPSQSPLPESLSMSTCLGLVLPSQHPLKSRITTLRRVYDPNFDRYEKPVIKLIYPFLRCIRGGIPEQTATDRIQNAIKSLEPFQIHLTHVKAFTPAFSREDYKPTFSIRPSPKDVPMLNILQSALVGEFAEEIASVGPQMSGGIMLPRPRDPGAEVREEPWEPRISLGRKAELSAEEAQERFERGIWGVQPLMAEDEEEARRFGHEWGKETRVREVTEEEKMLRGDLEASDLAWEVDRVSVFHNKGTGNGYKVVGEVLLGGKGVVY